MIEFDKTLYEVYEDIGKTDLAVRVCINIFNLTSERTIRIMTASGTAVGRLTMRSYYWLSKRSKRSH